MKNFSFILLFLLFCSSTLWGQISRQEKKIDLYYEAFNYTKAIAKYEKLANISLDGKRKLAESYRRTYNFAKAQSTYEGWIDTDKASKEDLFAYASLLRMSGDYPKANQYLMRFSSLYPTDLRARNFVANINRFPEFSVDRGFFTINNLSMNSSETDFGTAYFGNKVVFASSRARKKQFAELYNWNQKPYLNLFVSRVLNGQLVDPQQFNKSINKKWHEGTASFYNKGRFMVFTRDNYSKKSNQGEINLQLYFSAFTGTDWSEPLPFKYNNPDYSFGHPSISEDGCVLYFASNMPGGFGGVDIYCSQKDSLGQWSVPVNLGDKINTEDDDMFPFFEEKSQTLFFASRGHLGLGGLDLFRVKKRGNTFGEVKNMGAPINSQGDDFALIIDKSLNGGYFSSNRKEGRGDDDIYSFKVTHPFYQSDFTLNLVVMDDNRKQPVANAEVVYNDTAKTVTNTDGNVTWHLPFYSETKLAVTAKGLLSQTRKIKVTESEEYEILRDTMQLMQDTVTLKLVDRTTKRFVLRHVYYNFNRWDLLPASFVELDKVAAMLGENPALKAELGSHTDRRGSDNYNLKLSQLRAQSAVDYLVGKGIAKNRIKAVGYGKRRLINPCVDCTEAQHRENRRTEISLPGFAQSVEDTLQFTEESIAGEQTSAGSAILSNQVNRAGELNRGEIRYWLYVDSSHDENWSRKLAEKLARQGYNATVVHIDNFYRVGIGCPSLKSMRQIYNVLKFRFRTAWFDYAQ